MVDGQDIVAVHDVARDARGSVWLAITNLDPNRSVTLRTAITGMGPVKAIGEVLTAERVDAVNAFQTLDLVVPQPFRSGARDGLVALDIPAKSLAVNQVIE
jgi:alpha-N-arabinofuranosidase